MSFERPTPRVDKSEELPYMEGGNLTWWVPKDFARKLERELDSAKDLNRELLTKPEAMEAERDLARERGFEMADVLERTRMFIITPDDGSDAGEWIMRLYRRSIVIAKEMPLPPQLVILPTAAECGQYADKHLAPSADDPSTIIPKH